MSDDTDEETADGIDRRDFLKKLGIGTLSAAGLSTGVGAFLNNALGETPTGKITAGQTGDWPAFCNPYVGKDAPAGAAPPGSGTAGGGTTGTGTSGGFDPGSGSAGANVGNSLFAPTDGFADLGWFPSDDLQVLRVTNLDGRGDGSFRWALKQDGPTLVVFEVSGVVDLGGNDIRVKSPKTYVAGQTAPSPGITTIKGTFNVEADNVIVQHIRSRPGETSYNTNPDGVDAINSNETSQNVIFDHCTASWSIDECASTGIAGTSPETPDNVTFSNNLIAEPLDSPLHSKGGHSKGMLLDIVLNCAVLGNVIAHSKDRNPKPADNTQAAIVNNYIYNFNYGFRPNVGDIRPTEVSMVGNVYESGPDTPPAEDQPLIYELNASAGGTYFEMYAEDNKLIPSSRQFIQLDGQMDYREIDEPNIWPAGLTAISSDDVKSRLLPNVGARPADRTPHDIRVIETIRNGGGRIITGQDEVGGYPNLAENRRQLTPPDPGNGLQEWLDQHTRAVEVPGAQPPD